MSRQHLEGGIAVKSDRTTLYNEFKKQGHGDVAEILRKL